MPERMRERPTNVDQAVQAARRDLVQGLQMMSTDLDPMIADFAYAAGVIVGAKDAPARILGMIEFGLAYHKFGMKTAEEAIERSSGVPVDIVIPDIARPRREPEVVYRRETPPPPPRPGLLVGIVGAEKLPETGAHRFNGVAVMNNRRDQAIFVPVSVSPDGTTTLRPELFDPANSGRPTTKLIEELYPPTQRRTSFRGTGGNPERRGGGKVERGGGFQSKG